MEGEAHNLAHAYLYLVREEFSTGQVIIVDGGTTLVRKHPFDKKG